MRFDRFIRNVAPAIAMAVAAASTASRDGKCQFNGKDGVRLSDLDLAGAVPDTVHVMGPDIVRVVRGEVFSIAVEGGDEAKDRMRFVIEDGALFVLRGHGDWTADGSGVATVTVTLPAVRHLVMAGSGEIHAAGLTRDTEITIAGSGMIETPELAVESLEVSIAGSGSYRASGNADRLDLSIAGSGSVKLKHLAAGSAELSIAGSGDADFACDGAVKAHILGSGNVTVRGSATCTVRSFGSGTLKRKGKGKRR